MAIESNCPWVSVTPAPTTGLAWRVTRIEHLTGAENAGRANVFVWCKIAGRVIYDGLSIRYGWQGQRDDEQVEPKRLDKKPPDPSTDIAIFKGMHLWIEIVDGTGFSSDRVSNLHAEMPFDGSGNERHHHSYNVEFSLMLSGTVTSPVVTEPPLTLESVYRYVQSVDLRVKDLEVNK